MSYDSVRGLRGQISASLIQMRQLIVRLTIALPFDAAGEAVMAKVVVPATAMLSTPL